MIDNFSSAYFTICSANYLPTAKILIDTLELNTDRDIYIIICDKKQEKIKDFFSKNRVKVLFVEDLKIENFDRFILRYSILEINTAIKPFVFNHLLGKSYDKVFYFDPDISIESSLEKFEKILDNHNALLTPHIRTPYEDESNPSLRDISNSGIYNLGFLGLRSSDDVLNKFLPWWKEKCEFECYSSIKEGLFTDQKFCDYLPVFVQKSYIHYGSDANIAYWNLHERKITEINNNFFSNDQEVLFFHFSGLSYDESFAFSRLSKHENRFKKNISPGLRKKINEYLQDLKKNSELFKKLQIDSYYGLNTFKEVELDISKRSYIKTLEASNIKINVKEISAEWFNSPARELSKNKYITRNFLGLYLSREDLRSAFNIKTSDGTDAFLRWIKHEIDNNNLPADWKIVMPRRIEKRFFGFQLKIRLFGFLRSIVRNFPSLLSISLIAKLRSSIKSFLLGEALGSEKIHNENPILFSSFDSENISKKGINIFGYFDANTGVANGAKLMDDVINEANISSTRFNVDINDNSVITKCIKSKKDWDISLFHVNADQTPFCIPFVDNNLSSSYKIGFWAWELDRFPAKFLESGKFLNDLWVPSNFIADSIMRSCDFEPKVVPHALDVHSSGLYGMDKKLKIKDKFTVATTFDCDSYIDRKNPAATLNAFIRASEDKDFKENSCLIIKLSGKMGRRKVISEINEAQEKNKFNLILIDQHLSDEEMAGLRNVTDVFISLHRSEGFGLNLIENMSAGNLVIATNYSGNTDFMNHENSLLVDYKMISLKENQYPEWEGQFWADPSIEDASKKLLWSFRNNKDRKKLSMNAKKYIEDNFSIREISKKVSSNIEAI